MANFVKLTHKGGNPVWINPAYIETVITADGGTRLIMTGTSGRFEVQESLEDVLRALGIEPPAAAAAAPEHTKPARTRRSGRG